MCRLEDFKALAVPVTILNENELKMTSTYDFESLDIEKAASMPYFQNFKLKEMIKLTPEEVYQQSP